MNLAGSRIVDIRVNNNLDVISDNAIMQCIHSLNFECFWQIVDK